VTMILTGRKVDEVIREKRITQRRASEFVAFAKYYCNNKNKVG
jgi:hypothetical protein